MPNDLLIFNGIDGDTGQYSLPPMHADELVQIIRGETTPENLAELRARRQQKRPALLGVKEGIDPLDLADAGWGVIFPHYSATETAKNQQLAAVREALQPLLKLRSQSTKGKFEAWVYGTDKGFRVGVDTKNSYLARYGAGPGPADPMHVPYYLLIVGSPAEIPYRFQSQLDVQYAVGRIYFDTVAEYAHYAATVVAAEQRKASTTKRRAVFFGVANPDDISTNMSASELVRPVAKNLKSQNPDWKIEHVSAAKAKKARLATVLGGNKTPALLFAACHGMNFAKDSNRQREHQGALLCQDWPGPQQWAQAIPQDFYFAGDDLAANANLGGMVAFFFACYGAGMPQFSEFARNDSMGASTPNRREIAPFPFLARLPMRMLGKPNGALAVVGHVERAWSYSFKWEQAGSQTTVFESALQRLLNGYPIGSAIEYFNERYAELSTVLSDELEELDFGKPADPFALARMWTANNDARGYAIIGDPAVRVRG